MQYAILMYNNWKFVLFDHIIYIYIDALADQCYLIQTWRVFQNIIVDNIIVDQDQLTCLLLRDLLNLKNRLNRQVQTLHCMVYVWPMNNLFKYMTRRFIDHHLDFRHYYATLIIFGFAVCIFIFFMSNFMMQL